MWAYPELRFVGDSIAYHAARSPRRLAIRWNGRDADFADIDATVDQLVNRLIEAGLRPGDRLLYLAKNSEDFFLALFACARAGACFTPVNWRLSGPELAVIVADIAASMAIVDRELEPLWTGVASRMPADAPIRWIDAEDTLRRWSDGSSRRQPDGAISEDAPVIALYTSGTTGRPKAVIHTHASFNHSRLSEHLEKAYEWRDGDVFLNPLPNFHLLSIALSLQCLYNGVALSLQKQFDPAEVLAAIGRDRPSLLVLTPTLIQMLLDHPAAETTDFSSVRMTMYAGSPIALGLIKRAMRSMPGQFMQFYGQTETSGPVCLLRPDEHDFSDETKLKSCGRPLPLIALRVVDDAGNDVPDGTPGELLIRAPSQSAGYWRQPEETRAKFSNGWYHSGDVAFRDAEGLYYIFDRLKDMIITGGENVYSAEVENVLSTHPDVGAVAVVGVPDQRWGEAVKAVVIPRRDSRPTQDDLLAYCRERLAGYKVPKSIDFVESFPVTGTGKISKKDLRAPYWADVERRVS
jgi:long-chain acyl-CoA synthetase